MPRDAAAILWAVFLAGCAAVVGQDPVLPINRFCPVMTDREVDENSPALDHQGKSVRLCCKKCVAKFRADPEKYLPRLPQFGGQEDGDPATSASQSSAPALPSPIPLTGLLGRFHPIAVHFPIAFLLLAAALEAVALALRQPAYGPAIRPLVLAAAAAAITAAILGSFLAEEVDMKGAAAEILDRHSFLGWTAAALSVAAVAAGEAWRRRGGRWWRGIYSLALFLGALIVGAAGHAGGTLVFGSDWFSGG